MNFKNKVLAVIGASAITLAVSSCNKAANSDQAAATATPNAAAADSTAATPPPPIASTYGTDTTNWFGGAIYDGKPALEATAALVKAGGGAEAFSFPKALVSMLGEKTVNAEVAKLNSHYGKPNVDNFLDGMTFAVMAGLKRATALKITLPDAPADLHGAALAKALINAGLTADSTFWSGRLFDVALSHPIHVGVMADIDAKSGHASDENTHKILNQAMYDFAQALGEKHVKLALLH
jgi:hypothetical protein